MSFLAQFDSTGQVVAVIQRDSVVVSAATLKDTQVQTAFDDWTQGGPPGPAGPAGGALTLADIIDTLHPVGALYISTLPTNPGTLLGRGTWTAFGTGRVLVGHDAGDTDFDTVEEIGGAKTVTLTEAQLPTHTHVQNAHSHGLERFPTATGASSGFTADTSMSGTPAAVTQVTAAATATNQTAGSGQAHPNLQPYIVVHMWKRTA